MSFTGPIEDRLAIRETGEAYADAVFRRDAGAWAATWAQDARWDLAGTVVEGRDAIVQLWTGAMAGFSFVAFFSQLGSVAVSGDRATARHHTAEDLVTTDGKVRRVLGNGVWRFASRTYRIVRETGSAA